MRTGRVGTARAGTASSRGYQGMALTQRPLTGTARMKFHFFSFQIHGTTGYMGHA